MIVFDNFSLKTLGTKVLLVYFLRLCNLKFATLLVVYHVFKIFFIHVNFLYIFSKNSNFFYVFYLATMSLWRAKFGVGHIWEVQGHPSNVKFVSSHSWRHSTSPFFVGHHGVRLHHFKINLYFFAKYK